jgi:hypothetical protein
MTDEIEHLATDFAALLSLLEEVLSPSQVWELEVFLDYDEHDLAFHILCSMLRSIDADIPQPGRELLAQVAQHLGVNEAHWRDLGRARRH